ncbi:hypothetical protein Acr_10g0009090 [Actinidia rufa]|uniref:Uncharacterized protein n=1 Tax=Actinidia rufa TaxID=165716 RepID=A0A7J0FA06_9ERIC|nr:hypothetical protein Acr_10g0009090 [Actinidia rufa]
MSQISVGWLRKGEEFVARRGDQMGVAWMQSRWTVFGAKPILQRAAREMLDAGDVLVFKPSSSHEWEVGEVVKAMFQGIANRSDWDVKDVGKVVPVWSGVFEEKKILILQLIFWPECSRNPQGQYRRLLISWLEGADEVVEERFKARQWLDKAKQRVVDVADLSPNQKLFDKGWTECPQCANSVKPPPGWRPSREWGECIVNEGKEIGSVGNGRQQGSEE